MQFVAQNKQFDKWPLFDGFESDKFSSRTILPPNRELGFEKLAAALAAGGAASHPVKHAKRNLRVAFRKESGQQEKIVHLLISCCWLPHISHRTAGENCTPVEI